MIEFTKRGIHIGEKELPLYSGAVHYWRLERRHWEGVLDAIVGMGFQIIETYIPWSVHEVEEGSYDFGEIDERKNLEAFLQLCEEKKLYVIVRPGPHINAEMTLFGYPEWILLEEAVQAKSPEGTPVIYPFVTRPFPIPSYASDMLFEKTERYFTILAPLLKRHCYPRGGIIAIQADNETCYFFRDKPYVMDYSKDSVALYHRMLQEKYGDIGRLAAAYGKRYERFEEVKPSCGYGEEMDLSYYYDWVEYKEYQVLHALKRITDMLRKMELQVPIFHNCAYQIDTPISLQRIEQIKGISVAGIDAYPERNDTSMLKKRIRYMAGSSRLPFVPEFGSGSWFDRPCLLNEKEEEFGYLYAFMNGMKAVNFYMLAERDRWCGCPVTADGRKRENFYKMFQDLIYFLKNGEIHRYFRKPKFLILKNYRIGRLDALLSVADFNTLSSNIFVQGPDIPAVLFQSGSEELRALAKLEKEWLLTAMKTLDEVRADYDLSDEFIPIDKLESYSGILVSSLEQVDAHTKEALMAFASKEGNQLISGMEALACVKELAKPPIYDCREAEIELSVHYLDGEEEERFHLLYVANTSASAVKTSIFCNKDKRFENLTEGGAVTKGKQLQVTVLPYRVLVYRVEENGYDK